MVLYALTLKMTGSKTPQRRDYGRWFETLAKYHLGSVTIMENIFEYGKYNRLHVHGILGVRPGFDISKIIGIFKRGWHVKLRLIETEPDLLRWRIYMNKEQSDPITNDLRYEQYLALGAGYPFV